MNQRQGEPRDERQKEMVRAVKEGIKEWLSEQMATFGWWSFKGLGALALGVLVYLWLSAHGWKAPQIAP
jgi:hypothetical protein